MKKINSTFLISSYRVFLPLSDLLVSTFTILRLRLNRQKWISNPMSTPSLLLRSFCLFSYCHYSVLTNENKAYHIAMQMAIISLQGKEIIREPMSTTLLALNLVSILLYEPASNHMTSSSDIYFFIK